MHSVYVNADQPGASHVQIATGQTGHHPVVISQRRHADPSSQPVNKSLCASTHWSPPCGGWEVEVEMVEVEVVVVVEVAVVAAHLDVAPARVPPVVVAAGGVDLDAA